MKKATIGVLAFTVLALFFTTGCLGKGQRQVIPNPQGFETLDETAEAGRVNTADENSTSLYEDPFFGQDSELEQGCSFASDGATAGTSGSASAGGNTGGADSDTDSSSADGSVAGDAGDGSGAPGDLPPHIDEEPPAGDPPAESNDDLIERMREGIREQALDLYVTDSEPAPADDSEEMLEGMREGIRDHALDLVVVP